MVGDSAGPLLYQLLERPLLSGSCGLVDLEVVVICHLSVVWPHDSLPPEAESLTISK